MAGELRGLVLGSGFAGQGHARALRDAGVNIVGMVARTPAVVEQVARDLGIPSWGADWKHALDELKPDLVAIGTPGGAHYQPVLDALDRGCHVYCDKPLSATAAEAKTLYRRSRDAGVKSAFAASFRYQPHALLARDLVKEGAIGEPWEVECVSHYNLNPLIPFGWSHRMDQGGGRLNNNFTHKLSIAMHVLDGAVVAAKGEARNDMPRAPVVGGVHDFRIRERYAPTREEIAGNPDRWSWADVDAEWSYTVLAQIDSPYAERQPVSALFRHGGLLPRFHGDYVAFYGSRGAIHIEGSYAQGPLHVRANGGQWSVVPMRKSITDAMPEIEDDTQRNWTQLAREFVADTLGRGYSGYQTFRDGWIFQEVIDAVRSESGWTKIDQDSGRKAGRRGLRLSR